MTDIIIRPAEAADLESIIRVFMGDTDVGHGDNWTPERIPAYQRAFSRIMESPDNLLFVTMLDGAVVGTFQVTLLPGLVGGGRLRAKFESVHVLPQHRGDGIGGKMIAHAIAVAKGRGAGIVELSSNKKRLAAHRFYERLGFAKSHEGFKLVL